MAGAEDQPQEEQPQRDEAALKLFLAGDLRGFETLVRTYQDSVFRLALGDLGDREDARDAAQEVLLRAFRGLKGWRFEARVSTWLFRVTLNVCHEIRRRKGRERARRRRWALWMAPLARRVAEPAFPGECESLRLAVEQLPRRQREVVVLGSFRELSVEETAAVLGVPLGTVKSNFSKAVANLRARLARKLGEQAGA